MVISMHMPKHAAYEWQWNVTASVLCFQCFLQMLNLLQQWCPAVKLLIRSHWRVAAHCRGDAGGAGQCSVLFVHHTTPGKTFLYENVRKSCQWSQKTRVTQLLMIIKGLNLKYLLMKVIACSCYMLVDDSYSLPTTGHIRFKQRHLQDKLCTLSPTKSRAHHSFCLMLEFSLHPDHCSPCRDTGGTWMWAVESLCTVFLFVCTDALLQGSCTGRSNRDRQTPQLPVWPEASEIDS